MEGHGRETAGSVKTFHQKTTGASFQVGQDLINEDTAAVFICSDRDILHNLSSLSLASSLPSFPDLTVDSLRQRGSVPTPRR